MTMRWQTTLLLVALGCQHQPVPMLAADSGTATNAAPAVAESASAPGTAAEPRPEHATVGWYLDRSGSMAGFRDLDEVTRLHEALDYTLKQDLEPASVRYRYLTVGKDVVDKDAAGMAFTYGRWLSRRATDPETNLHAAIAHLSRPVDGPDLAFLVTDGLPADGEVWRSLCGATAPTSPANLVKDFGTLARQGYGLWLGGALFAFDGPHFLGCGQVDRSTARFVTERWPRARITGCGNTPNSECSFSYQGKRPLIVFAFARQGFGRFVEAAFATWSRRTELANAQPLAIRLWPAANPSFVVTPEAAYREPPGEVHALTADGQGVYRAPCIRPGMLVGLALRTTRVNNANQLLPSSIFDTQVAVDAEVSTAQGFGVGQLGTDALELPRWLAVASYPPRFEPLREATVASALQLVEAEGTWISDSAECPAPTCRRLVTLCGPLEHKFRETPAGVAFGWRARTTVTRVPVGQLPLDGLAGTPAVSIQPDRAIGLREFVEHLGRELEDLGVRGPSEIARTELRVTAP